MRGCAFVNMADKIKYQFAGVSMKLYDKVLESDLTKHQLKIVLQIWRMTFGCKNLLIALYRPADFGWGGVRRTVIDKELQRLVDLKIIRLDKELGLIGMNPRIEEWECKSNGNLDDLKRSDLGSEIISKQLRSVPLLRILQEKTFDEIRADSPSIAILKKLNTGRILRRNEIQEVAEAFGRFKASVRTLAEEKRIQHDEPNT